MKEELIAMSKKEIERLRIIYKIMDKQITQKTGGELLGITARQVRRIIYKIKKKGDKGIIHGNRGRKSTKKLSGREEKRIINLIRKKYSDFGPTLASEKLKELDGIEISREKIRQTMIDHKIWRVRKRDEGQIHGWRERKHHRGEMIQGDGSDHDWLESRGPRLVLMGYIDDATSELFGYFYKYEGTYPALDSFYQYIHRYGIPKSVYMDKHSTYKTNREAHVDEELKGELPKTQFSRALGELGVKVIYAHSPQAKGRIERVFETLQDRLVKEMRLAGISTLKEANAFLQTYLPKHNSKFSKSPFKNADLHRPLSKNLNLKEIFCLKEPRTVANDFTIRFKNKILYLKNPSMALKKKRVLVLEGFDGVLKIKYNKKLLDFEEVTHRDLNALHRLKKKTKSLPGPNSPQALIHRRNWNQFFGPNKTHLPTHGKVART